MSWTGFLSQGFWVSRTPLNSCWLRVGEEESNMLQLWQYTVYTVFFTVLLFLQPNQLVHSWASKNTIILWLFYGLLSPSVGNWDSCRTDVNTTQYFKSMYLTVFTLVALSTEQFIQVLDCTQSLSFLIHSNWETGASERQSRVHGCLPRPLQSRAWSPISLTPVSQ